MLTPEQLEKARIKRLIKRDKFVEAFKVIVYAITMIAIFISLILSQKQFIPEVQTQVIEHIVKQGENLTQIASKYSDDYVLKAVADIKKLNGMKESNLQVGQTLKIVIK